MQFYKQALSQYEKATPVQKSYFNIGLTLGLLIILLLLIFPALNHILKLNKEISDGRVVGQKLQQKILDLEEAELNYNNLKDRLKIIDDALPTGSAVEVHLKQIEKAIRKNNLTLSGIQFSDVPLSLPVNKQNLKVRQIDYTVSTEGKFTNVQNFMTDLESLIRTTDLRVVSIIKEGTEGTIVTSTINATVYYLGETKFGSDQTDQKNTSSVGAKENLQE